MSEAIYRVFGIGIVTGFLALVSQPVGFRCGVGKNGKERIEAINNGKQIWLALSDHQKRYGSFPNEETMQAIVKEKGITPFSLKTSNDYFRLLIAGGFNSEKIGYCHYPALPIHRPDGVIAPLEQAFATGEVGFAYVANVPADAPGDTPILMAPLIPRTLQFDPKPFAGRAVVVFMDGSAKAVTLRQGSNLAMMAGGKSLLDLDAAWWHGKAPELKYPAR
ncbi:MAG TPA: hypothetical protein VGE67_18965 [Haloferula sp.]